MSGRFRPVPLTELVALGAGTAALVAVHATPLIDTPYADWAAASAEARQALGLAVVWAASCSAWVASLHASSRSITCPATGVRNGAPVVAAQLGAVVAAGLLGHAVGLAPLYLRCALGSTYAADFRPLVVLGGAAVLVAGIALGYLCGVVLPRLLAAPAAAALVFASVTSMGVDGEPWSTIWPFGVGAGLAEPSNVGYFRLAFFLTVAVLCTAAAARWLGSRIVSATTLAALGITLAPVVLLAQQSSARDLVLVHRDTVPARCGDAGTLRVCVHPASQNLLPTLVAGLTTLRTALGPEAVFPALVTDGTGPGDQGVVINLQPDSRTWRASAILEVASSVLRTRSCWTSVESGSSAAHVTGGAALWFASIAEPRTIEVFGDGPSGRTARSLLARPADQVGPRLRGALPLLTSCRASLDDLLP